MAPRALLPLMLLALLSVVYSFDCPPQPSSPALPLVHPSSRPPRLDSHPEAIVPGEDVSRVQGIVDRKVEEAGGRGAATALDLVSARRTVTRHVHSSACFGGLLLRWFVT